MSHDSHDDDEPSIAGKMAKGALMVLGGLVVFSIAMKLFFGVIFAVIGNVIFLGALGGAAYFGYRMVSGGGERKSIEGGRSRRALGPARGRRGGGGDDFERKMRELEAIERRLDAEIGKR
jgi:hypothetical protein